ncbi:MAG: hypothetical protein F4X59_06825 [Holophagales bacterium]|nr:hypothetical protein [Holophagales bacterium]
MTSVPPPPCWRTMTALPGMNPFSTLSTRTRASVDSPSGARFVHSTVPWTMRGDRSTNASSVGTS